MKYFLQTSPTINAAKLLNILFAHWTAKSGIHEIPVTDKGNINFKADFTLFRRTYKVQFKPRTPYHLCSNGLAVKKQLTTYYMSTHCFRYPI